MNHNNNQNSDNVTPAALLEQLVYVDTFMPEIDDASQLDARLTAELSAFADDSFVFPDEDKPKNNGDSNENNHDIHDGSALINGFNHINNSYSNSNSTQNAFNTSNTGAKTFSTLQQSSFNTSISSILSPLNSLNNSNQPQAQSVNPQTTTSRNTSDLLSNLPKVTVPPGAQSSLIAAGLSQTQIDALAALVAQHQGLDGASSSKDSSEISNSDSNLDQFVSERENGIFKASSVNPSITTSLSSQTPTNFSPSPVNSSSLNDSITGRRMSIKIEPTGDADIDKRKRNTAASARFRIKKKLKEQQLERSVRELNELTITLEKKIQTLEMENKLLRNLVVEKGEQRNNDELEQLRKKAKLASTTTSQLRNNLTFDEFNGTVATSNDINSLVKNEDFNHH